MSSQIFHSFLQRVRKTMRQIIDHLAGEVGVRAKNGDAHRRATAEPGGDIAASGLGDVVAKDALEKGDALLESSCA
jgi:hypothetical protein